MHVVAESEKGDVHLLTFGKRTTSTIDHDLYMSQESGARDMVISKVVCMQEVYGDGNRNPSFRFFLFVSHFCKHRREKDSMGGRHLSVTRRQHH